MDVDLARLVLRNRAVVGQGERILLVIRCPDLGCRHPDHGGHEGGLYRLLHLSTPANS
ncbi:hypothetical protein D3C84_1225170 [compost metagenome]